MKKFEQFIKEEIDLKGNTGIPDDLMSNADKQAAKNLGVRIDDPRQEREIGMRIMPLVQRSMGIMMQGMNREQLEERFTKLETLAKNVIMEEYGNLIDSSEKPIELKMTMLRPGKTVNSEIPEMKDIPSKPKVDKNLEKDINDREEGNSQGNDEENDDENYEEQGGESNKLDISKAVDKKKILNVINQGEAKATKEIIRMSELVKPGLEEIFGAQGDELMRIWLEITDLANKLDWAFPIEMKSRIMKDMPQGMAGACQVKWENDEEGEEGDDSGKGNGNTSYDEDGTQLVGDQEDFNKITIKAVGIDFPMLIHEAVKGIWSLLKSGSIKDDEEVAKLISQYTTSFEDEAQDFRYGVPMQAMFRDFINACKGADLYSNMNARVYAKMALDKDRGGDFTDPEFLEVSKSIFSSFVLEEGATLQFVLDMGKFGMSDAKRKIEAIISDIIEAEKDYERQLSEWEMDKRFGGSEEREEETHVEPETVEKEEAGDLSKMKQSEIQELIDDALDRGDYAEVERVSKYLKEGREIYLKELQRINESHSRRKNK